jgi:hypothetical protein
MATALLVPVIFYLSPLAAALVVRWAILVLTRA